MAQYNYQVELRGNLITLYGELSLRSFPYLASKMHQVIRQAGYRDLTFEFTQVTGVYPSVAAPFVALLRYYRQEYAAEFDIKLPRNQMVSQRLKSLNILNYMGVEKERRMKSNTAEPRVFVFENSDRQYAVVDAILNASLRRMELDRSQLKAVEWAVNEITDNVINHSRSKIGGAIIASRVPRTEIIEFVVADCGIGIARSLGIQDDDRAIESAIQEGVTRNKETNQGNGLYGSFRLAQVSEGAFSIKSGMASLYVDKDSNVKVRRELIPFNGTVVLCQIDCSRQDLIQRALVFNGRAHDPAYDYLEKMHEREGSDPITVNAKDICKTFGSRESGREARNYLKNVLNSYPAQTICVDLADVNIVSSSYADEAFGKLFVELGPMRYMRTIQLNNSCAEVEVVIDRAITLRSQTGLHPG